MADNDIVIGGQQPKKVEALRPGEERLRLELKLATAETEKLRTENDSLRELARDFYAVLEHTADFVYVKDVDLKYTSCLLYTSPSPRDQRGSRMPSSA